MEQTDILNKLEEQEIKIDSIYKSVEKTSKYILTIVIISVIAVALPIVGLLFAIPSFLNTYSTLLSSF